jgi:hypothetical protein
MWNVVSCVMGTPYQFRNVKDCLHVWLKHFSGAKKRVLMVGVAAIMWSIWKAQNIACFQQA